MASTNIIIANKNTFELDNMQRVVSVLIPIYLEVGVVREFPMELKRRLGWQFDVLNKRDESNPDILNWSFMLKQATQDIPIWRTLIDEAIENNIEITLDSIKTMQLADLYMDDLSIELKFEFPLKT